MRGSENQGRDRQQNLRTLDKTIDSEAFDPKIFQPLLHIILDGLNDEDLWDEIDNVLELALPSTPPLQVSSKEYEQTPYHYTTSSMQHSFERTLLMKPRIQEELRHIYVEVDAFDITYFGCVPELKQASSSIFQQCMESNMPLFSEEEGWRGWPQVTKEDQVREFPEQLVPSLATLAGNYGSSDLRPRRRLDTKPRQTVKGSTGKRLIDIAFVDQREVDVDDRQRWSDIVVPGELKATKQDDRIGSGWNDRGKYVREVFGAQESRRFVLGFSLCGSTMRAWAFDWLSGFSSTAFDINKDGRRFVFFIVGFL